MIAKGEHMENRPPVSIYVVTYLNSEDRGKILKHTCEVALRQRYPAFEVVVSDNGGSLAAADALASIQDPRLRICTNTENAGFTGNVNRCLQHCAFDVIKLLCDDDLIHPDFLAATVPLLDDHTLIVGGIRKFVLGDDPAELGETMDLPVTRELRSPGYGHDIWALSYVASCIPSATVFSRALFKQLGGYNPHTVLSDWDFFIEACLCAKVVHVPATLCFVGVWGGSLTEEMTGTPYFFPRESLYTLFRVLHCKVLSPYQRLRIWGMVFRGFIWQGMRLIKHPVSKTYWRGFFEYLVYQFDLMFRKKQQFGEKPNPLDV